MQLERVRVQNYKCLRDVTVEFLKPAGEEDPFSAQLLVGVNGSGKSCFLEALGLIFTRIMQGEVPGFPFVLEYRIQRGQAQVKVRPAGEDAPSGAKLDVIVIAGGKTRRLWQVPEEYLPRRIVACSSGANHLMESVLLSSPRASLASDLYDLAHQSGAEREPDMAWLLEQYEALDTNPRVFSVDGGTAKLIVPVLFAVIPNFADRLLAESCFQLRDELLRRVGGTIFPVAFSITVDEDRLEQAIREQRNSPQYSLLAKLFRREQPDGSGPLHSWMVRRIIWSSADMPVEEEAGLRMSQTAVFCYDPWQDRPDTGWRWSQRLSEEFDGDPMLLLNVLMAAHRRDILLDIQLAFHREGQQALLGLETLSDGELMWLARMGLVLMSRLSRSAETLFLFDEPDVHFNNEWNMDFIKTLRLCSETQKEYLYHEFVIATHSTLLLTDTYPEQINLFSAAEGVGVQVKKSPISPFAAQQDELARLLFSASAVGSYALRRVDSLMEQAQTPEEVLSLIQQTGPGYQRFRLYERYYELKKGQS